MADKRLDSEEYIEAKLRLLKAEQERASFRAGYWDTDDSERPTLRDKSLTLQYEINDLEFRLLDARGM